MKQMHKLAQYIRLPILNDGSDVIQWWNKISPAERLRVVIDIANLPIPSPDNKKPTYVQHRVRVPNDDDDIEKLEKFRSLKPEQRLLLLRQFHQE